MSRNTQERIREYFNYFTCPAAERGRHDAQKRLDDHFGDRRLKLRYHKLDNEWQVWYEAPNSGLYCVINAGPRLEVGQLIKQLQTRQKSSKAVYDMYKMNTEYNEITMSKKIRSAAEEMARQAYKSAVGKVTSSVL